MSLANVLRQSAYVIHIHIPLPVGNLQCSIFFASMKCLPNWIRWKLINNRYSIRVMQNGTAKKNGEFFFEILKNVKNSIK